MFTSMLSLIIEGHKKLMDLKHSGLPPGSTFFLGQYASTYNVALHFSLKEKSFLKHSIFLPEEEANQVYNLILISLEQLGNSNLNNGIFVSDNVTNFFSRNTWEFDASLYGQFCVRFKENVSLFIAECSSGISLNKYDIVVLVQKYGQNQVISGNEGASLGEDFNRLFNLNYASSVRVAIAESFSFSNSGETFCPFFDFRSLEKGLFDNLETYGLLFASNVGNFQGKLEADLCEAVCQKFESTVFASGPFFEKSAFHVVDIQGYNTMKSYLRKQKFDIPFCEMNYTTFLSRDHRHIAPGHKLFFEQHLKNFAVFDELLEKLEILAAQSFESRVEIVYSYDVRDGQITQYPEFSLLLDHLLQLHRSLMDAISARLLQSIVCIPSEDVFGLMYVYVALFKDLMSKIIERQQKFTVCSLADIELTSIVERLIRFMFTGSWRILPTRVFAALQCKPAILLGGRPKFSKELIDGNAFILNIDKYKDSLLGIQSFSMFYFFKKVNTQAEESIMDKMLNIEILLFRIRQTKNMTLCQELSRLTFVDIFLLDTFRLLKQTLKKHKTQENSYLIQYIQCASDLQKLSHTSRAYGILVSKYVKKQIKAEIYMSQLLDFIEANGGKGFWRYSNSIRNFDLIRMTLSELDSVSRGLLKQSIAKHCLEYFKHAKTLFLPHLFGSSSMSKYYLAEMVYEEKISDVWQILDPRNRASLLLDKIPLLEDRMRVVCRKAGIQERFLRFFQPCDKDQDAVVLIKAAVASLNLPSLLRKANHMAYFILFYLAVKKRKPEYIKLYSKTGKFSHVGVKGIQMVRAKICQGKRHGTGFIDLQLNPLLKDELQKLISLRQKSLKLYTDYLMSSVDSENE